VSKQACTDGLLLPLFSRQGLPVPHTYINIDKGGFGGPHKPAAHGIAYMLDRGYLIALPSHDGADGHAHGRVCMDEATAMADISHNVMGASLAD